MRPFYEFVREERQYCAVLAHLLMSSGENLRTFVQLVNQQLADARPFEYSEGTEIYLEYSYLRDKWRELSSPLREDPRTNRRGAYDAVNLKKREFIADLLLGLPEVQDLDPPDASRGAAAWNQYFMGSTGGRIVREVASPALWPVSGLAAQFAHAPATFYALCKVKWSFRIKPDLVMVMPDQRPLCIEAKMESPEGAYPTGSECGVVDGVMGAVTRCRQFELQDFMFSELLGTPCQSLVIAQKPARVGGPPALSWGAIFTALDHSRSIPFVERFLHSNENLIASYAFNRVTEGG
jgi:hypothetical protein